MLTETKKIYDKRDIYQTISTNDLADLAFRRMENEKSIIRMEDNQKEILKLQAIEDSPYFGYVEFCEDGESETESIHIGFQGITTSQYESLIYDWRTPIASLYYDYPVGRATFFVPSVNNRINGLNKYKAQIIIKDQIIQKILPTTDTPNEDALLYELQHSTFSKMKNIVSTIQKEQNEIIRLETGKDIVIQGVAGSGKTSVALHRIAYLLFKKRGTLNAKNFLLLAPSKDFAEYINNVLPEMGEDMIPVKQLDDIALDNLTNSWKNKSEAKSEYIYRINHDRQYRKRYIGKSNQDVIKIMKQFKETIEESNFNPQEIKTPTSMIDIDQINYLHNQVKGLPIRERIKVLTNILFEKTKMNYPKSKHAESRAQLKQAITNMFVNHNLEQLWQSFKSYAGQFGVEFVNKKIEYGDIFLLAILQLMLTDAKKYSDSIKYLIIDEMQDYSVVQYWYINQIFSKEQKMILGDENQQLLPGGSDVMQILSIFTLAEKMTLETSYRSTKEIINFANAFTNHKLQAINRSGEKVQKIGNLNELKKHLLKLDGENQTVAIVYPISWATANINHLEHMVNSNNGNISIIDTAVAKGLEFDCVFMVGYFDNSKKTLVSHNEIYVAATRATKALYWIPNESAYE